MYHPKWRDLIRCLVIVRDEFKCFVCQKIDIANHIHHIDSNIANTQPDNLITLCASCHHRFTKGKFKIVFRLSADVANRHKLFNKEIIHVLRLDSLKHTNKSK